MTPEAEKPISRRAAENAENKKMLFSAASPPLREIFSCCRSGERRAFTTAERRGDMRSLQFSVLSATSVRSNPRRKTPPDQPRGDLVP